MKKNLTELVFILDRSGSMHGLERDVIGGFNSMLREQKAVEGEAVVSTVLFDHEVTVLHDRLPLEQVPEMTGRDYFVRGSTALLDAVGGAIHHIGNVHKYARREDVPEKTLFVINTDGMENASCRYTRARVKQMITRQQKKYGWEFLFLGANMDAVAAARDIGIRSDRAAEYINDDTSIHISYRAVSRAAANLRTQADLPRDWADEIREDTKKRR